MLKSKVKNLLLEERARIKQELEELNSFSQKLELEDLGEQWHWGKPLQHCPIIVFTQLREHDCP